MKARFVFLLGLLVAGCGGDPAGPPPATPLRLVVLMDDEHPSFRMGDSAVARAFRLDRAGLPINPDSGVSFHWSSSDTTVLTVDSLGVVTMQGLGTADVIARLRDTSGVYAASPSETASGRLTLSAIPTVVEPGPIAAAFMGDYHQCIVRAGGQAFCRGDNLYGQLGNGTTVNSESWVAVSGGPSFVSIVSGSYHVCGLTGDQRAFCWGRGHHGQLGNGSRMPLQSETPVEIAGYRWLSLDAGGHGATCGIRASDSIPYCFGHNDFGQVGREPLVASDTVVAPISGSHRMTAILTKHSYTCGLETDGSVYCSGGWGPGTNTGIGGAGPGTGTPTRIGGTTVLTSISVGAQNGCGLTASGGAYCWGLNEKGQAGTGDVVSSGTMRAVVGAPAFRWIHAREMTTCGITADGDVWCWGLNWKGALGRSPSQMEQSTEPIRVRLNTRVRWIQGGDVHMEAMCAITESHQLICWGAGY